MWLLSFITMTDLGRAAQEADVNVETRNIFLDKLLLEHSQPGIEEQLKTMWGECVDTNYNQELEPEVLSSPGMEAVTPENSGAEEEINGQGNGVRAPGDGDTGSAAPVGSLGDWFWWSF